MKTDFIQDKRLMKEANTNGSVSSTEDLAQRRARQGKSAEEQRISIERQKKLDAARNAATQNATTVGGSEATAQGTVQNKAGESSVTNSETTARNQQDIIKQGYMSGLSLFNQSATSLMQAEQSIEQMKAGFSGMLQMLGTICKHLGADEFGESCLDLAKELEPKLVKPNAEAVKAIEDYKKRIDMDPEVTQAIIAAGRKSASDLVTQSQADVVSAGNRGVDAARNVEQPTVFDAPGGTGSKPNGKTVSISAFDAVLNNLASGKDAKVSGSETVALHDKFVKFAGQGGDAKLADEKTEFASIIAAVRMEVQNKAAQDQILSSVGLLSASTSAYQSRSGGAVAAPAPALASAAPVVASAGPAPRHQ